MLGWVAERYPELVRRIASGDHEIASHGYAHRLIYDQTPQEFRSDLRRSASALIGRPRWPDQRLSSTQLLGDTTFVLGAGHHSRGRLHLRRERVSDPARSVWTAVGTRHFHPIERTPGTLWECPGSTVRGRRHEPSSCGRRLFPSASVLVDAMGDVPSQRERAASCDLLFAPVGNRSGSTAASGITIEQVSALHES